LRGRGALLLFGVIGLKPWIGPGGGSNQVAETMEQVAARIAETRGKLERAREDIRASIERPQSLSDRARLMEHVAEASSDIRLATQRQRAATSTPSTTGQRQRGGRPSGTPLRSPRSALSRPARVAVFPRRKGPLSITHWGD